jgi:outer membrane receptor for ferrienterochelin and colicin
LGKFHSKNSSLLFTTSYEKQLGNFDLKAYAAGGEIEESVIDTSSRKYNWAGDYIEREPGNAKGELFQRRSYMIMTDKVLRSNLGIDYSLNNNHGFSLSINQDYLHRKGEDKVNDFNRSYESPNYINKNMLGVAYNFNTNDQALQGTIFGKEYWYSGKIVTYDYEDNKVTSEPTLGFTGYGAALSYHLTDNLLIKSSYEKAYRIPESFEILGDGIYVNPNPNLQPEKSSNFNFGGRFNEKFASFRVKSEFNFFFRSSRDFIRFNPLGPFGEYENLSNVRSEGIEGSININYKNFLSLNTNLTYQNITDQTKFDEGLPNVHYQSRVPNIPYFFGNARIGFSPSSRDASSKLHIYINFNYVHEFFLNWEKLGNREDKNIIPAQFTQDLQVEYSMIDGMYNLSLSINNITDRVVYDNFNIQKPGRSVNFKLRYFLN